jgi:hypothetical protein
MWREIATLSQRHMQKYMIILLNGEAALFSGSLLIFLKEGWQTA